MVHLEQEKSLAQAVERDHATSLPVKQLSFLPYNTSQGKLLQAALWSSCSLEDLQAKAEQTPLQGLLFLPGLGGSCLWAQPFLQPLQSQLDFVIGLDLQGFGLNQNTLPLSPEEQLSHLLGALPQLLPTGLERKTNWHVAGISLGALMATRWVAAMQSKLSIQSLTLLAPGFAPHPKRFSTAYILKNVLRLLFNSKATLTLPYGVSELTSNRAMWEGGSSENPYSEHGVSNPHPLTMPLSYMLKIPAFGKLALSTCKTLSVPVHFLIPKQDKICDTQAMQQAFKCLPKHLKHAYTVLPNASHDLLLESEAPQYGKLLQDWLKTL
jgi:alpha-beta hydrolase superfamily lysophospholipase